MAAAAPTAERDPSWLFESLAGDAEGRGAAKVLIPETLIFRMCVPLSSRVAKGKLITGRYAALELS